MILHLPSLTLGICGLFHVLCYSNILIPAIEALSLREDDDVYDFIIIGAGSSGAVLANRLTEAPNNYKVLLLEAGGDENPISQIPLLATVLQFTNLGWHFKSEPQEHACFGMNENRTNLPCGKALGGTSAINVMLYMRGNRRDYDRWASFGNYGWSWKEVFPYFLKSENNISPQMANDANHGKGGLLTVSDLNYRTVLLDAYLDAVKSMGYKIGDLNGEIQSGAMPVQTTTLKGKRFSTNKAFIKPASKRQNLHIKTHARALKILFDEKKRAIGVVYRKNFREHVAKASKEVIVSAGTINTPKLLMLSGIGPKKQLDQFNIVTISDLLGVGENLHDHVMTTGYTYTVEDNSPITIAKIASPKNLLGYLFSGTGPLSSPSAAESEGMFKTRYVNQSDDWPDLHVLMVAISPLSDFGTTGKPIVGYNDKTWKQYYVPHLGKNSFSMYPTLMRPKSKGFVKLRSKNPFDDPIIDPKYLSHPDDVKVMIEGMKITKTLGSHSSFKKHGAKLLDSVVPGCEMHKLDSDDYLACFARHMTSSVFHMVGTAKMGNKTDPMAVVDPELRVYGVEGLRVVDCSIMPEIISGNPNAPAIMIGEKASDLIKNTWKKNK